MKSESPFKELAKSRASSTLLRAAEFSRLRRRAMLLAFRLERGQFFSSTARMIMQRYFQVSIGAYSYGSCFTQGAFQPNVTIGRYVSVGPDVLVYRRDHPIDHLSTHPFFFNSRLGYVSNERFSFATLEICADAWIGARVVVTPGCSRIGIGSIVGAGAVLTRDVPDFSIVAGVPARSLRSRFPADVSSAILRSKWWRLSIDDCVPYLKEMQMSLSSDVSKHPLLAPRI